MKKSLLVLTAALSFGVAAAQTAPAPQVPALTDVPAGHWAKDAIDLLVSKGILLGYPDGTFRGTQNLTRYEAAVIIARLLDQINVGEVSPGTLDEETLTALQNAIQELAADLAALGVRVSDLEENAVSQDDFARLEERVEMLAAAAGDAEALAGLTSQIEDLTARADDYDTLRADVDDNASQIAALNDLTVLLNQDILNLQDRVSAVEAAQADLVARADFDALNGRVTTVETKVTSLDNRVALLEKYAFSIKPSLSATYYVARSEADMDFDRLIPGTVFSTGTDSSSSTKDAAMDYADMTGSRVVVDSTRDGYYGFSTSAGPVYREGATTISFGITFGNSGKFGTATSASTGAYVPGPGGLNVNTVDVSFGIQAGLPNGAGNVEIDGTSYMPLYFYYKNATAQFTVGNAPVTVTFGKALKFKFADYIGDNDAVGRGDGYIVNVDGSTLPVLGAFKPTLTAVYGSKGGANGDGLYYRGIRATITPVGTLKAGVHVLQEGRDAYGIAVAGAAATAAATGIADNPDTTANDPVVGTAQFVQTDVTAFGADLHGTVAGWKLDSEYASSRITGITYTPTTPGTAPIVTSGVVRNESAFYIKTSGTLGPVKVYDLNYRSISAGYDAMAGIMEANPKATNSTAPYAANQTGFGIKVSAAFGPVAIGGYSDNQVNYGGNPFDSADGSLIVDRGVAAKLGLFNLVTVRGGYYQYLSNALEENGVRYTVRADVNLPRGFAIGAYYQNVTINGDLVNNDGGLFSLGKYHKNNVFGLNTNELDSESCGGSTCYSEYGVELNHDGAAADALVKNLNLTLGYRARYSELDEAYTNTGVYGTADYTAKVGVANIKVAGGFDTNNYGPNDIAFGEANTVNLNGSVEVKTDPLNTVFKPSFEAYVKAYSATYDYAGTEDDFSANDLTYRVGVKLNEFLLPNTKLAVYYAGYTGTNRVYVPFTGSTPGDFTDVPTGATVTQNLLYVEANYYDLSFGYGYGNLSLTDGEGSQSAKGSVFKINYKVNF